MADHNIPVPDPTSRTTAELQREIEHVRSLLILKVEAVDERLSAQLAADIRALYAEIGNREKGVALALDSAQKAVDKAEAAADKRFESVNEFRAQLADQAAQFVPREVFDTAMTNAMARIERNTDSINLNSGRDAGMDANRDRARDSTRLIITAIVAIGSLITVAIVVANFATGK